jgi:peptidylprolyl isomerase
MFVELAIMFIVIAIIAAIFGFRFLAGLALWIVMAMVVVFFILFVVSLFL